jgi:hypothetical protein
METLTAAVEQITCASPDIRRLRASDGSVFLFSTNHLDPSYAASLAEWLAVGRLQNP